MWDTIGQVLTSGNGVVITILLVILVIVTSKYGLVKIKTDKVTIGKESSDNERTIIRQQYEYAKLACDAFEMQMPKFDGYDNWRGRYIAKMVEEEIYDWITQNHIRPDKRYIEIKQNRVWNIIQKYTIAEAMEGEEFHAQVNEHVKTIIESLVNIRKEYS